MKTTINQRMSRLYEIAESQQGYFSAKQAETVGFLPTNYTYHVKTGSWIREARGVYRLKNFPLSPVGQYILFSLWSRDRNDQPQGVLSHETALSIYDLSDLMPAKIHMTVPKTFRKWAKTPKILTLYYENLDPSEIEQKNGFKITKPLPTILALIKADKTSSEFIEQAFIQSVSRGLIQMKELNSLAISKDVKITFKKWLEQNNVFKNVAGGKV